LLLEEHTGKTEAFTLEGNPRQVTYLTRIDPFSGNVAKISEERARKSIGISTEMQVRPVENCVFCSFKNHTPKERIQHNCGAITVPNLYPWEKYDWITIYPPFTDHKLILSDLYFDDLERMVESSFDLASICFNDPEALGFVDFTNWGVFAGASQQHPHSQRKSMTSVLSPVIENEMRHCKEIYERTGKNPFDLLVKEEREDGRRIIHDDGIFISAMFAPTTPDEILVFPKENFTHILQTGEEDRRRIISPVLGIFPALFFYRGVTDLNIAVHMANFAYMDESRKYYRWHMHIYPRRARLPSDRAGAEMGFGTQVIDSLPEVTAELLRCWYQKGPCKELLAKTSANAPDPCLVEQFGRFLKTCR
jgi:galactose-1-phosphate uridylyltransferase